MLTATRINTTTVKEHHYEGFRYESRFSPYGCNSPDNTGSSEPTLFPVVLIGGAFQRKEDWGRIEKGLLMHADVLAVDLPGWGAGDLLPPEYDIDFLTHALIRLLDDYGLTRINVLAGSYGTAIGYRLGQLRPDLLERMVLIGTMPAIPDDIRPAVYEGIEHALAGRKEEFAAMSLQWLTTRKEGVTVKMLNVIRRILWGRLVAIEDAEIDKFVANTRRLLEPNLIDTTVGPQAPILFGVGEHDTFTPPHLCRSLAQTCPSAQFVQIKESDHLIHLERPGDLVDLAVRFYHRIPVGDAPYLLGVEEPATK
ncbi:alpha/beta fold hydrolase [Haloglycomyces albus]|uniref:alpha/beta fold hydrolase n=1 Tax=Haloglycomyces albus TaxID=526067 RepID=UPI00046D7D30|nr:alpha/beta hydrolase [Haloglycomyces albus]